MPPSNPNVSLSVASIILRSSTDMTSVNDSGYGFEIGNAADFYQWRTSNGAAFTPQPIGAGNAIVVLLQARQEIEELFPTS